MQEEGSFNGELIKVITAVQPNIKWKELQKLLSQLSVEFPRLAELQLKEDEDA